MKINLPVDVEYILSKLEQNGFESYIVGGCVRDIILQKEPKDWDVVTSAKPHEIQKVFPRTFDVGIKHGTIVVPINGVNYEVTTFRADEGKNVGINEDLSKRDFTINAMAYSPQNGLIDLFSGRDDLEKKSIKAVGSGDERFSEDPLRMLRAIRFSAQLGFGINDVTLKSLTENAHKICNISVERIREELTKILLSDPQVLNLAHKTDILKYVLPELDECFGVMQNHPYHIYDVAEHTILSIASIEKDFVLRWTMLFHDLGKPITQTTGKDGYHHFYGHQEISSKIARKIMTRLKFDNDSISDIITLVECHDHIIEPEKKILRRKLSKIGKKLLLLLLKVQGADALAQNTRFSKDKIQNADKIVSLIEEIEKNNECISLKDLAINGNDLMMLGMIPSREMGKILDELLYIVVEHPAKNNKEELKIEAIKIIKNFQP